MYVLHRMTWLCLLLACVGASYFAYQSFLVPQNARFVPHWQNARWVRAKDGTAPVAYFRHVTNLNPLPDAASLTIASNQVFRLYVNGTLVGSNAVDFGQGNFPRAYIYDVISLLQAGPNVIALRVANVDKQMPMVRVSFGIMRGTSLSYDVSGETWQATALSALVYPRYSSNGTIANTWAMSGFNSSSWPSAQVDNDPPISPMLTVNPLLYEQPLVTHWLSAGPGHDAYFVRQFSQPLTVTSTWLRVLASGTANIFINGRLLLIWNGQAAVNRQNIVDYLSNDRSAVHYRKGLALGIYDISPYLHPGINTLAIHVVAPGISAAQVGLNNLSAALSLDMLTSEFQGRSLWSGAGTDWHASSLPVNGWTDGSSAALRWSTPIFVGRPGVSQAFYLPDTATARNVQVFPLAQVSEIVLLACGGVLGLWLLMALGLMRRYYSSRQRALEVTCLAYLPALACEALLVALAREPQIPQPFPYTTLWGLVLVALIAGGYLLLWLNARGDSKHPIEADSHPADNALSRNKPLKLVPTAGSIPRLNCSTASLAQGPMKSASRGWGRFMRLRSLVGRVSFPYTPDQIGAWLRDHWPIIPLVLVAIPLISYNLSYEPYWQDELSSYYASQGVLAHGLPFFPSGFLYEKAELYSYLLAAWTFLLGNQGGATRLISALEYIISIPLLYLLGGYFFGRRVALLAAAMLAFSPISLVWGRQVRMYEQAQVLTLAVLFLFYKALEERQRVTLIYVAMLCLVANYLSHEETFIILPALLLCVLVASKNAHHRLPAVLYQKHWWYAAIIGALIILLQLLLTRITHPPVLGTDSSQEPLVRFTTDNIPYYFDLLFVPSVLSHGSLPWITVNSMLATAGCFWARRDADPRVRYCALFLVLSLLALVLLFTLQADRYIYPLLPIYYLMGAYAMVRIGRALWDFACPRLALSQTRQGIQGTAAHGYLARLLRGVALSIVALCCISVLVLPILPISRYNLFISRVVGFSYHRHYPDYDVAGQYLRSHWRKGDIVISVAPDFSTFYYTGHVDYFFSVDRALFLLERNGHIVDTSLGVTALLNQDDFQTVLAAHPRVWILSDNGVYQEQVSRRFVFPPDFSIVFEGYGSAIYFRGG